MSINAEMLAEKAKDIRIDIIREVHAAASGHPGGSLSAADIITYLYFAEMNIDPKDPNKKDRDRFVLSKGHAAPALYAALAEKGYFPKEELLNLRKIGCMLQGHPDRKKIPGVDMSTGSLGQGVFCGSRYGSRKQDRQHPCVRICAPRRRRAAGRSRMGSSYGRSPL